MAKNARRVIGFGHFGSGARVNQDARRDDSLTAIVRSLTQHINAVRVDAANVAALTDSSGGTAGATYGINSSGVWSNNNITGFLTGVQAAALNAAADTYMNAYREIANQLNAVLAVIGAGVGTIDEGPGAAPNDIIEAITVAVTANTGNTDAATTATARAVQADLLHAQRTLIHALDDVREAVGLARSYKEGPGRFVAGASETLVFADANPDTLTRNVGSWVNDGFRVGDTIQVNGTLSNNRSGKANLLTINAMTATVLTFISANAVVAESLTAAQARRASISTVNQKEFPGRLPGAGTGPDLTEGVAQPGAGGPDWTLSFLTGAAGISDAVNGADATSAVLKTEVDATLSQLRNNIAFINARLVEVTGIVAGGLGYMAADGGRQ